MRWIAVITTCGVVVLTLIAGSPAGLAQTSSDQTSPAPGDQSAPPAACLTLTDPAAMDPGDGTPICAPGGDAAATTDAPPPVVDSPPPPPPVVDSPAPPPPPVIDSPPPPPPVVDSPPSPTATPTPTPTPTATPTSAARVVPAGTLARQLPFANPGDDNSCDLFLDGSDQPRCDPRTFPAAFNIQLVNGPTSLKSISLQIDGGQTFTPTADNIDVVFAPGRLSAGDHTLSASLGQSRIPKLTLSAPKPTSPHFLVFPRSVAAGATAQIYLAGLAANADLPLGIYRERQDCAAYGNGNECYELLHDLGTVHTDGSGNASRSYNVPSNEQRLAYLVATPDLKVTGSDVSAALRRFGRPWFSVY